MVTEEKIYIYIKYRGDIDSWSRSGSKKEKAIMNDNDWYLIDNFIQDIYLVKNNLASQIFEDDLNKRLNENCDNSNVIDLIKSLKFHY